MKMTSSAGGSVSGTLSKKEVAALEERAVWIPYVMGKIDANAFWRFADVKHIIWSIMKNQKIE